MLTTIGDDVDGIIDGGTCEVGIESTILDLSGEQPQILRPGQISQRQIEDCLGYPLSTIKRQSPRAPGILKAHYAPATPLLLVETSALDSQLKKCLAEKLTINLWSVSCPQLQHKNILWQASPTDNQEFAKVLYHQLRQFDTTAADITLIQRPPELVEWQGVIDRLSRAAAHFSLDSFRSKPASG